MVLNPNVATLGATLLAEANTALWQLYQRRLRAAKVSVI